jgi:hypothetical protein
MAGTERRDALGHRDEMEHQDGLEWRRTRPLRGALPTAGRKERLALMLLARRVEQQAQTDELVLAQAHWLLARQASLQPAPQGPVQGASEQPARRRELQPQALLAPRTWRSVLQAQLVLQRRAQRWLVAEGQVPLQASSARPSPRHPWRPSPL